MEEEPPKKKIIEHKPKRFFLSSVNSYLMHQLVDLLQHDHPENPHLIIGTTIDGNQYPVPKGVRKVIDSFKMEFLKKAILDSDVIVYDIATCDISQAEFAIKTLKLGDLTEEKTLIIVSSVMVWSATNPKEKKAGDEEEEAVAADSQEEEQVPVDDDAPPKKEYVRFTEADYPRRVALPQYEAMRSVETLAMAAKKKNLTPYILSAGVLYGMGEQHFYQSYKAAFLQQNLRYFGNGKNKIPTIHVKDLALFVAKVVEKPPNQNYIFCIDHAQLTQKKIIEAISKGMGNGIIEQSDESNHVFQIDLRMRPTKAFDQFLEEAAAVEDNEDGTPADKFTFNWWCKEGIRANIAKIRLEFLQYHKLNNIKVLVTAPPASGKTALGQAIAKQFNIPLISFKPLMEQYLAQNSEEIETLKGILEDAKKTLIEEGQAAWEIEKKKRKTLGLPYVKFDESIFEARMTDEQVIAMYKWRLLQNDCQNRGFVLDGYPKTYQQAKQLFYTIEGEDTEDKKVTLNKLMLPEHVICIKATDQEIIQKAQSLTVDVYDEAKLAKRLANYRKINTQKGYVILTDFFKEEQIAILNVSMNSKLQDSKAFIERNGPYNNYQTYEQQEESQRLQQINDQKIKQQQLLKVQSDQRDQKETELLNIQEEEYKIKQEHAKQYEKELLDTKSLPLRQYLDENVVPFISKGLVEIVQSNPTDPIDFLAEFLFKSSLQVPYPNPKQYFEKLE